MKNIKPYEDIEALNQSRLKQILKSPYHFQAYRGEESSGFAFGSIIHMAVLEPEVAKTKFKVKPDTVFELRSGQKIINVSLDPFPESNQVPFNSMSSRHRELLSTNYIWIDQDKLEAIQTIMKGLSLNDHASTWLKACEKEKIVCSSIMDVECKGRIDGLSQEYVLDLKTTDSILNFEKSMVKYGYDFQLAFYMMLTGVSDAKIIVCENKWPYAVATFDVSEQFLEMGKQKVIQALTLYKQCVETNNWPSYQHSTLQPPSWYINVKGDL